MSKTIELPPPTEFELQKFNKSYYFERLLPTDLSSKLKISHYQLTDWLSENYNSILLDNTPLKFKL